MKKLKVFGLCFMAVVILSMSGIEPVFAKHRWGHKELDTTERLRLHFFLSLFH